MSVTMENKIEVIDNFLDEKYFKELQELIFGRNFAWARVYTEKDGNQFVHPIFLLLPFGTVMDDFRSPCFHKFLLCLQKLKASALLRIKVNLLTRTEKRILNAYHGDMAHLEDSYPNLKNNGKTSILYMNTNNGVTKFEESGKEVESVANRMVIFPMRLKHAGSTNTDSDVPDRCVINFNYF